MENKKKILIVEIVEDDVSLSNALSDKFENEHFEVLKAKNGEEGLTVALRERPDIILLDIIMPVMDGITMLHKLREDEWGKKAHVVVLTNVSDMSGIARAIENGAFEYYVKSDTQIENIVESVKKTIKVGGSGAGDGWVLIEPKSGSVDIGSKLA